MCHSTASIPTRVTATACTHTVRTPATAAYTRTRQLPTHAPGSPLHTHQAPPYTRTRPLVTGCTTSSAAHDTMNTLYEMAPCMKTGMENSAPTSVKQPQLPQVMPITPQGVWNGTSVSPTTSITRVRPSRKVADMVSSRVRRTCTGRVRDSWKKTSEVATLMAADSSWGTNSTGSFVTRYSMSTMMEVRGRPTIMRCCSRHRRRASAPAGGWSWNRRMTDSEPEPWCFREGAEEKLPSEGWPCDRPRDPGPNPDPELPLCCKVGMVEIGSDACVAVPTVPPWVDDPGG
mmetsp:Transcript_20777/g.45461  ORF Transcript_20777/g.45461 Transcript_20777/m.45461 type:complete len:288 (-) Transcript_20777:314-1177(-)